MKERTNKNTITALGLVLVTLTALLLIPVTTTMGAPAADNDGDGYNTKYDCNDGDSAINPGAEEICDNKDNNCDGQVDEGDVCGFDTDVDNDDWTLGQGDCNDLDPAINPEAIEICDNGIDEDCDGFTDEGCAGGDDADGDGFSDYTEEFLGIWLPPGLILAGSNQSYLPVCEEGMPEESCVRADRPDLFVVINRASNGNISSPPYGDSNPDPLAILRGFTDANGNPVVPHELQMTGDPPAPRLIADGQNAVIVNELLDAPPGALGFAPTGGTPNSTSGTVNVYTERIKDEVDRLCQKAYICPKRGECALLDVDFCQNEDGSITWDSASGTSLVSLYDRYTQNVIAHEVWHVGSLAPSDSAEVVLFHFNANTGWVMEQSIGSKGVQDRDGTVTVTLYISDIFNNESRDKYKLK